jgi:hypothetical protein
MSRFGTKKPEPTPSRHDMSKAKAALKSTGYGSEEVSES